MAAVAIDRYDDGGTMNRLVVSVLFVTFVCHHGGCCCYRGAMKSWDKSAVISHGHDE